ncbi:hypothetical protein [Rossellomorea marisflavi]|uniref:hypothetical protein n=1 Tax=Rossellomorea marisflavi TaxID=189381 RepID=UPI003D2ED8C3
MQRRPPDSYGNSGQGETLQARRSGHRTPHGKRGAAAKRNDLISTTYSLQNRMAISYFQSAHPLSYAQSAVQRRPPDSYGRSGQGETLQAFRSGTERSLHLYILTKNRMALACFESALSHNYAQSAVQRRPPDSYGRSGQGETLQAAPKRLTARPMESGWPQRNGTI